MFKAMKVRFEAWVEEFEALEGTAEPLGEGLTKIWANGRVKSSRVKQDFIPLDRCPKAKKNNIVNGRTERLMNFKLD